MKNIRHFIIGTAIVLLILAGGTGGYMYLEGWPFLDALYMTVITISTVGFKEVAPVDESGRIFTMALVVFGMGFTLYMAGAIVQVMLEGHIRTILGRRRLDRKIKHMRNHYIVCGYGRIGRVLARSLIGNGMKVVVVDSQEACIPEMEADGVYYHIGDAVDETHLQLVGIERASALVAVLGSDVDNVFLVLTARQLNPSLFITARASGKDARKKLIAAGADSVESPYEMGAMNMAQKILRPTVTSFLEFAFADSRKEIQMEEIEIPGASSLIDVTLKDSGIRQQFNLIIIAIKKPDGEMIFNPSFETVLRQGDTLIAVGEVDNLTRFAGHLKS